MWVKHDRAEKNETVGVQLLKPGHNSWKLWQNIIFIETMQSNTE